MPTKIKKKPTTTTNKTELTPETAELLKKTALQFLTQEETVLLIRALNSNLARTQALKALKDNSLFF